MQFLVATDETRINTDRERIEDGGSRIEDRGLKIAHPVSSAFIFASSVTGYAFFDPPSSILNPRSSNLSPSVFHLCFIRGLVNRGARTSPQWRPPWLVRQRPRRVSPPASVPTVSARRSSSSPRSCRSTL